MVSIHGWRNSLIKSKNAFSIFFVIVAYRYIFAIVTAFVLTALYCFNFRTFRLKSFKTISMYIHR